jgi:hypothetical protein
MTRSLVAGPGCGGEREARRPGGGGRRKEPPPARARSDDLRPCRTRAASEGAKTPFLAHRRWSDLAQNSDLAQQFGPRGRSAPDRQTDIVIKSGRTRRYHCPNPEASVIAAVLALRDHVLDPILAGVRSPRPRSQATTWTVSTCDYETLRIDIQTLLDDLGITTGAPGSMNNSLPIGSRKRRRCCG